MECREVAGRRRGPFVDPAVGELEHRGPQGCLPGSVDDAGLSAIDETPGFADDLSHPIHGSDDCSVPSQAAGDHSRLSYPSATVTDVGRLLQLLSAL